MTAYYNEFDPFAAQWLRNLISAGHIAPGDVDERSITDVQPDDLAGYTQCHFFAGIGVWSHALRTAGWPDDREVWTGSCPCQPFSVAGSGRGTDDPRHLWPDFFRLIEKCHPPVVFGEQVASKDGLAWLDLVQADMEGADYAFGAVDTCAAGLGAPHIRQRLYFVADAASDGLHEREPLARGAQRGGEPGRLREPAGEGAAGELAHTDSPRHEGNGLQPLLGERDRREPLASVAGLRAVGGMADSDQGECRGLAVSEGCVSDGQAPGRQQSHCELAASSDVRWMADPNRKPGQQVTRGTPGDEAADGRAGRVGSQQDGDHGPASHGADRNPSPTNGLWRAADWLYCRDGKWRPVEPGTFPLADGTPNRVGRLRGYGNALNAAQAEGFIAAYLETEES